MAHYHDTDDLKRMRDLPVLIAAALRAGGAAAHGTLAMKCYDGG